MFYSLFLSRLIYHWTYFISGTKRWTFRGEKKRFTPPSKRYAPVEGMNGQVFCSWCLLPPKRLPHIYFKLTSCLDLTEHVYLCGGGHAWGPFRDNMLMRPKSESSQPRGLDADFWGHVTHVTLSWPRNIGLTLKHVEILPHVFVLLHCVFIFV